MAAVGYQGYRMVVLTHGGRNKVAVISMIE